VQEYYFNVDVFPVFVKEVLEEVGDGLVGDVSADHDVPLSMFSLVLAAVFGSSAY
jgi:hypothetical protein